MTSLFTRMSKGWHPTKSGCSRPWRWLQVPLVFSEDTCSHQLELRADAAAFGRIPSCPRTAAAGRHQQPV